MLRDDFHALSDIIPPTNLPIILNIADSNLAKLQKYCPQTYISAWTLYWQRFLLSLGKKCKAENINYAIQKDNFVGKRFLNFKRYLKMFKPNSFVVIRDSKWKSECWAQSSLATIFKIYLWIYYYYCKITHTKGRMA